MGYNSVIWFFFSSISIFIVNLGERKLDQYTGQGQVRQPECQNADAQLSQWATTIWRRQIHSLNQMRRALVQVTRLIFRLP